MPDADAPRSPSRRALVLSAALLVAACAAVYAETPGFGWVHWDDYDELVDNPALRRGLTPRTVAWAFSLQDGVIYQPVPFLSHALDVTLFGPGPAGPHSVNVALHAASAAALFLLLARATGSLAPSLLSAALWALHPLRAEPVAWVSGRKDLVTFALTLATVAAWAAWCRRPTAGRRLAVAGLFALAVFSKAVVVLLPAALLALDVWPLRRARGVPFRRLVLEKAPLLAIAALAVVPAFLSRLHAGAVRPVSEVGIPLRLTNAAEGFLWYVESTFLPRDLAFYYPLVFRPSVRSIAAGLLLLAVGTAAAVLLIRRAPSLLAGWIWFVVLLAPTIGFVQTGGQRAADRYSYAPAAGLIAGLVFAAHDFLRERRVPRAARTAAGLAGAALAAGFAVSAHAQARTWKDDLSLFGNAAEVTEGNWLAHYNLAASLEAHGDPQGALRHALATLEIAPAWEPALALLPRLYDRLGRGDELLPQALRALRADPRSAFAHVLAGDGALRRGDLRAARGFFGRALALSPTVPGAREGLAALDRAGPVPAEPPPLAP